MTVLAAVNELALTVFAIVLAGTLAITYWASRRQRTAAEFWAAGRGISGVQNGFAIAGDYLSASTFLGFAGLIFFFGLDGFVGLVAAGVGFVPLFLLLAERMRNAGKFTGADVLALRLRARPARMAAALGTLGVSAVYLIAQMVGAGVLLQALVGVDFTLAVLITGTFMMIYVIFGGMRATTWVQIIKAALMIAGTVLTVLVLGEGRLQPVRAVRPRGWPSIPTGEAFLTSGLQHPNSINSISFGLALLLGTAGLPHLLMRFFTVPDAKAARSSIAWGVLLIGLFFIMTMLVGVGARRSSATCRPTRRGRQPRHAAAGGVAGRRPGHRRRRPLPGHHQRGGVRHHPRRRGRARHRLLGRGGARLCSRTSSAAGTATEQEEVKVARIAALALGMIAIVVSILAGETFNVSILVGLAFAVAASANLPVLVISLFWSRFNTTGAIAGVGGGLFTALLLIVLRPPVWPEPDGEGSPIPLANPAIISIPAGFLACGLGTVLSRERRPSAAELHVRAETGLGSRQRRGH